MRIEARTAVIEFDKNTAYEGLIVRARINAPMSVYFELARLAEGNLLQAEKAIRLFAEEILIGWNLEDEDGELEANADNFMRQDFQFGMEVLKAWMEVVAQPSVPLGEASRNGALSLVESGKTEAS